MKSKTYQIFDEKSGLPIVDLNDTYIRKEALRVGGSCREVCEDLENELVEEGVRYMIVLGEECVKPISMGYLHTSLVNYYDDYENAKESLKG